ncbi:hypothetical protein BS50DRAFT_143774 [Corynespora cassiicola Philippines]|uniref:Uncharacterized protein n=1 Tax=Corynespora cassiicola Philippines TaxID=1448308 RepID=A0A2T2N877_CORCC|nr:hypothetical protein BS50DRAFT_143774 [Corynespora cassiicola Philippines]
MMSQNAPLPSRPALGIKRFPPMMYDVQMRTAWAGPGRRDGAVLLPSCGSDPRLNRDGPSCRVERLSLRLCSTPCPGWALRLPVTSAGSAGWLSSVFFPSSGWACCAHYAILESC